MPIWSGIILPLHITQIGVFDHSDVKHRHGRLDARQRGVLREVHVKDLFAGWVILERVQFADHLDMRRRPTLSHVEMVRVWALAALCANESQTVQARFRGVSKWVRS